MDSVALEVAHVAGGDILRSKKRNQRYFAILPRGRYKWFAKTAYVIRAVIRRQRHPGHELLALRAALKRDDHLLQIFTRGS